MSDPSKAVFLSYASQDAEAAKRICDALRVAGVEVWFDQSELRGGDAWDAKIRRQIKECALFVPIISANTNARPEGYFRLEWHLAEQRTYLMAHDQPFLFPVVIDDTPDATARVPEKFRDVQWTRLNVKDTPETLAIRVGKLLSGAQTEDRGQRSEDRSGHSNPKAQPAWLRYAWAGVGLVFALIYAVRPLWQPARHAESKPAAAAAVAPLSEARKLVLQARALIDDDLMAGRENFRLAQEFAQKATVLDPTDGDAWAVLARVLVETWGRNYDSTMGLREQARSAVDRATRLAPASVESGLAASGYQGLSGQTAEAERIARETVSRFPNDQRGLRLLAEICFETKKGSEALELLHRSGTLNGGDVRALTDEAGYHRGQMRLVEAEALVDRAMALTPSFSGFQLKLLLLMQQDDLDRAQPMVEQIPARLQQEDVFASLIAQYWLFRGEPDRALEILQRVPRDFFEEQRQYLPKGWPTGWALQMAGRPAAAKSEWEQALAVVEKRLKTEPNRRDLVLYRSRLLALLGRRAEADAAVQLAVELNGKDKVGAAISAANVCVCAGDNEGAIKYLLEALRDPAELFGHGLWSNLKRHPMYAPIRSDPRIQQLIAWGDERMRKLKAGGVSKAAPGDAAALVVDSKSVAVLAFANLSDDKGNEYFSDGISEELLNVLAKVPGLKVAARTSAFYFKGKEVPIPEIAKQLGVAYVVEGSVRKSGDKVRITAQLIKAADGFHVWSDTFTRDLKDIFAVQDEIAGLIAKNLELKMGITAARPTIDLEAYQEYLTGRALFAKAGNGDLQAAVRHFEKAVAIEPKFTAAWVQLASAHTQLGRWGGAPTLQSWAAARAAIDRALALEPDSPDVLLALGWILRTADWDWRGAEQAFRRSLQVRPDQPDALAGLAVLLFNLGRKEEAFRLGQQAARLDPLNPATQIDLSLMFYLNNNLAEAERSARRALQLAPGGAGYHCILAWSLIKQGRLGEAETEVGLDSDAIEKPLTYGLLAIARGQGAVAREKLAELEEISRTNGDLADVQNSIAWISVGLGEKDRPFAALGKARDSRDPSNSWLRSSPYLDPLHSDPRWNVLLHQVGLADDQLK